jgi:3-deoxy-manno-octulosonate cytidylyltransferase (CMP-KDO synthetase)
MSQIVGVIPSRYGSTRLPGKSLINLCGKPLVQWVYERARQAKKLDRILVATDDERIAKVVRGFGGEVAMTRADHPSGTDRIEEAVEGTDAGIIINIQGDEPLIEPSLIDHLAGTLQRDASWDMATAATPITRKKDLKNPACVKVVWGGEHQALYFSRSLIPYPRDAVAAEGPVHWRHIGIYAYRRVSLERFVEHAPCHLEQIEKLEQLRALAMGFRIKVIELPDDHGIGVDTAEDVPRAEALLRKAGLAR